MSYEPIAVPAIGVEFELTLDFDAGDPLEILRSDGIDPNGWIYYGAKPRGVQTRRFKLVQVGPQSHMDAVREALAIHGDIPEGMWREAFRAAYPTPNAGVLIGLAHPFWVGPDGSSSFPYLRAVGAQWSSYFDKATHVYAFDERWLWLVACRETDG